MSNQTQTELHFWYSEKSFLLFIESFPKEHLEHHLKSENEYQFKYFGGYFTWHKTTNYLQIQGKNICKQRIYDGLKRHIDKFEIQMKSLTDEKED